MEGTENNKCLPADLWMSQIDPQFSGNLGVSAMRDARTMSSAAHLDLSRKQPPLYSDYDLSNVHYKQNAQATSSSAMQQFAQPSNRSAWEFATDNFSATSKEFAPQPLLQPATTAGTRYSQSAHGYPPLEQNVSQSQARRFTSSSLSQPHTGYTPDSSAPQQSVRNFMSQDTQQAGRELATHNLQQQNARTDRSVWSHLYSLDPSIASYDMAGQSARNASFSQDKPYSYSLPRTEATGNSALALKTTSVPVEKTPLILGKVTSADQLSASYNSRSALPANDVPISSLASTVYSNMGNATVAKQKSSMSYEEEIGGYSPVSPPTHDTSSSPFSDLPNDRNTALSMKNDNFMMSSNISDFSSSSKALPVNEFIQSNPPMSDSIASSFDAPLDMSKGWSSQNTNRVNTAMVTSSGNIQSGQSVPDNSYSFDVSKNIVSNQRSDISDLRFTPSQPRPTKNVNQIAAHSSIDVFSRNQMNIKNINPQSVHEAPELFSVHPFTSKPTDTLPANDFAASKPIDSTSAHQFGKVKGFSDTPADPFAATNNSGDMHCINLVSNSKPVESSTPVVSNEPSVPETTSSNHSSFSHKTPKKSNFYGRDASYFSVSEVPDQLIDNPHIDDTKNDIISVNESVVSRGNVRFDPVSAQTDSSIGLKQTLCNTEVKTPVSNESQIPPNIELDHTEANFADSFIDATTAPSPDSNDKPPVDNQTLETSTVDEKKDVSIDSTTETQGEGGNSNGGQSVELLDCIESNDFEMETSNPVSSEVEPFTNFVEDPPMTFDIPNAFPTKRGGKAPRGRKRRGGATARRQTKKPAAKKALGSEVSFAAPGLGDVVGGINEEPASVPLLQPVPKTKARRGRKRSIAEAVVPDSDETMTRRSSSRRSKDNAMRLIELQAESIYGHVSKPAAEEEPVQEPPVPTKPRRKAAKAAVKSSTFSDNVNEDLIEEKEISSDELSDGKDADYAVDDEDVEAMEKDELLDHSTDQRKSASDKKLGGLKISIKLGVDSSAEIVSGLDKSPPRKKKKVVKKKPISQKFKSKAIIQDDDLEDEEEDGTRTKEKKTESEKQKSDPRTSDSKGNNDKEAINEVEEKGDVVDKHNSLMDKYFSSATQARPVQKPTKKDNQLKKHDAASKSKSAKAVKGSTPKTNAVPSSQSGSDGAKPVAETTSDSGVPKFVCGYCPNRYHNKQELMAHMEAHMAEMEDKPNKGADSDSAISVSKEPKKSVASQPSKKSDTGKSSLPKISKKGEESEALKYNCGECGKTFSSKPNLLDHVRTHAAEKPFECNLCHKFFKERDQLSVHRKVHMQEGLLRCQFCQKGFVNNADLTSHMETHPKRTKASLQKYPVPDPVKKATNIISDSSKKTPIPVVDSSKKTTKTQQISRDRDVTVPKPKSFASALEPSIEKSKDNPTLLLRRNDGSNSSSKDESLKTSKPVKSSKSIKEDSTKKASSFKNHDVKKDTSGVRKEPKDTSTVKNEPKEVKTVDQKPKNANDTSVLTSVKKEEKDNNASGECTCQECPECVTRFLNSFE